MTAVRQQGRGVPCPGCYRIPDVEPGRGGRVLAAHVRLDSLQRCTWSGRPLADARALVAAREAPAQSPRLQVAS